MQVAWIIVLEGILIPVGYILIPWKNIPVLFALYFGIVLALAGWMILLALGDNLATTTHTKVALRQVRRKQRELQEQIAEIKRRGSNGRGSPAD